MDLTLPSGTAAHLAHTDGADRGLVIVPDIWGLRPLFAEMCHQVAARTGWSVGCFEPFPGQTLAGADDVDLGLAERSAALTGTPDAQLLDDAVALADATGATNVGVIGFCMGGMYALKAAGTGRFDAVVSFYGMVHHPAHWAGPHQEQPLDAVRRGINDDVRVMSVIGGLDQWTPAEHVHELTEAGVIVVRYPEADHGFVHDPSRPAHRPDDAADAWDRALALLDGATGS
ncbi:MAG: dienelactone hydrolase family protein [Actinomycetes bacterium]